MSQVDSSRGPVILTDVAEAQEETPDGGGPASRRRTQAVSALVAIAAAAAIAGAAVTQRSAERTPPPGRTDEAASAEGGAAFDPAGFPKGALAGEPAPEMSFPLFDGGVFVLSEHLAEDGRPLVLNLWASWCTPCRREIPEFSAAAEANPGAAFAGAAVDDVWSAARDFAAEIGASYPLGYDENGSVAENYPFIGLPVTYLIAADGTVARQVNGQLNAAALQAFIDFDFDL